MSVSLGEVIFSAVRPIFKIYLIIGMGFLLAKRNILPVTTTRDISDIVVSAIMPCLIFNKIVANLKSSDIKNLGICAFSGTLLFFLGGSLAFIISMITRSPKRWLGGVISVGLFPNISDLPIAYMQTLSSAGNIFTANEGNKGVAYICIFLAAQVFFQFSLGLYQLIEWDFRDELLPKPEDEESLQKGNESSIASSGKEEKEYKNNAAITNDVNNAVDDDDDEDLASLASSVAESQVAPTSLHSVASVLSSKSSELSLTHKVTHLTLEPILEAYSNTVGFDGAPATRRRSRRVSISLERSTAGTPGGVHPNLYQLHLTASRNSDLRKMRSEDIGDVINEYSEFQNLKKTASQQLSKNTEGQDSLTGEPKEGKTPLWRKLVSNLRNFLAPNSVSLILSLAIAMSPPLKALFVRPSTFQIHPAPDGDAPLAFIMDFTSYVGAASVPLGLTLLGATIARLQVKKMPEGFWKTALALTLLRLVILPIIGVGLTTGFNKGGWYGEDRLVRFVSVLEFGLPSATALVYFTAFYTDPELEDHLQMDCLAVCLIFQYTLLFISLPFLVTFTIKVSLGL